MAHQHQVVDSDIRFAINPITRAITRVEAKKSSLVVGDHNSERFTFEIPKIVEGHDMTLCNVIRVHYLNTSSENKSVQNNNGDPSVWESADAIFIGNQHISR